MNVRVALLIPVALALALPFAALAQSGTPAPAGVAAGFGSRHVDPFSDRLESMFRESRDKKRRMVLWIRGEEIAGLVLEHGPGWVIVSNQPEQEILLRTHDIDRAEFR
jgi:hypothetical protein